MSVPNPIVELRRDSSGVPVLSFFHMEASLLALAHEVMLRNGRSEVFVHRANAGAHLKSFDPIDGTMSIILYGEDNQPFLKILEEITGMKIGKMERHGYLQEVVINGFRVEE